MLSLGITFIVAMLPRRLATGAASIACAVAGYGLALCAAVPAVRGGLDQFWPHSSAALFVQSHTPAWHPGALLLGPNALWLVATLALTAGALAILIAMTRDAYPELYDLSTRQIDLRETLAGKRGFAARMEAVRALRGVKQTTAVSTNGAPPGVWIFVWRSAIEFRRRSTPRAMLLGLAFWAVVGYGLARFALSQEPMFSGTMIGVLVNTLIIFSTSASSALALEMRRPIFWLSSAWLAERFGGFALGQLWPQWLRSLVAAAGVAAGGESPLVIATVALGLPALFALLLGTGYAAFALFPNTIDQRGPMAFVRIFVTYLLLAPPLAFFLVLTFALRQPVAGLAGFALVGVVEAALLVGFAAWRLDGKIDRLAQA
jgi:hypothetical protein